MPSFQESVDERFPGAVDELTFVARSHDALAAHGFSAANTIACVGVCRDELCRSLVWSVRELWGEAFNFSSLGGMLTLGTAGFTAAHYHAPQVQGRERYVYVVMPHIGINAEGELGKCLRSGRHGSSVACSALHAVLGELRAGALDLSPDPDNIEYSLLKQSLAPWLSGDDIPDIAALTISLADLIGEEVERMISLTVDPEVADYAVLTGVQIHCPVEGSMVWPDRTYVCVQGELHPLDF